MDVGTPRSRRDSGCASEFAMERQATTTGPAPLLAVCRRLRVFGSRRRVPLSFAPPTVLSGVPLYQSLPDVLWPCRRHASRNRTLRRPSHPGTSALRRSAGRRGQCYGAITITVWIKREGRSFATGE